MASNSGFDTGISSTSLETVGRAKINRPSDNHDNGVPTDDCLFDAKRVFRLIDDERYLSAEGLYQSIRDRIQREIKDGANSNDSSKISKNQRPFKTRKRIMIKRQKNSKKVFDERKAMALQLLDKSKDIVKKMEDRCRLLKEAKKNLDINNGWTLAQTLFGVTTYYRHESDGSMSIKLEGRVSDCSLFDQVAVLREYDLNYLWAPFVTSSRTVAKLDKLDIVGWFLIGLPHFGLVRDALFRAIGCDSIYENGNILIVAQGIADRPHDDEDDGDTDKIKKTTTKYDPSIKRVDANDSRCVDFDDENNQILYGLREDPILNTLDLPPIPTRMGGGRLTIRYVAAQIHLESPTSTITKLVANIDPNMHLIPQALIDFVMKRMCGTILYKMNGAAKNISKDPITNLHAIKIREEVDFYKKFLLPKFEGLCKIRGWKMPPISAFELSDAQLELAEVFKGKQQQKSEVKALKLYNSNNTDSNLDEYLQSSTLRSISDGEVLDNSGQAAEDGPKVRTMYKDLDDMSDISKFSTVSSFWRSNPISNYRRQVEERTQLRKHREIQESRERAAARLKPKSLNEDAILRLKELRHARNRNKFRTEMQVFQENGHVAPSEVDTTLRRWNISLSSHGLFTKIFVLQFMMVSLFSLLYLETAFNKVVAVRKGSFGMERGRDVATLTYIGLAGLVHSIFCYIALIYAFTALQLGSIAGKRTRSFYSQYVHYVVAITSASMVGLGIIKPGIDKAIRWVLWSAYSIFEVAKISILAKIPDKIATSLHIMVNAIASAISSTEKLIFESNSLGRCIVTATKFWLLAIVKPIGNPFAAYAETAIKQYGTGLETLPWREDTFFTTRALLSHSAFFLLVLLLLFNFAAKQARRSIYVDNKTEVACSNQAYSGDLKELKSSASIESNNGLFHINGKVVNLHILSQDNS